MNFQMEVFHQQLIELINNSGLPVGTAYFILKDCLHELELGYHQAILKEKDSSNEIKTEEIPVPQDTLEDISEED